MNRPSKNKINNNNDNNNAKQRESQHNSQRVIFVDVVRGHLSRSSCLALTPCSPINTKKQMCSHVLPQERERESERGEERCKTRSRAREKDTQESETREARSCFLVLTYVRALGEGL